VQQKGGKVAYHPIVANHPVSHDKKTDVPFGASMATQWYCPPDVGAKDAISAREAAVASAPMKQNTKP